MGIEQKIDPSLRHAFRTADLIDTLIVCDSTNFDFDAFCTSYKHAATQEAREQIILRRTQEMRRALRGPLDYLQQEGAGYVTPEYAAGPAALYALGMITVPITQTQAKTLASMPAVRGLLRANEQI